MQRIRCRKVRVIPFSTRMREFELAEEVWAQNLPLGVRPLPMADAGDRVFAAERFQRGLLRFAANAIGWVTKETNERDFEFDVFLSHSSRDRDQGLLYGSRSCAGTGPRLIVISPYAKQIVGRSY